MTLSWALRRLLVPLRSVLSLTLREMPQLPPARRIAVVAIACTRSIASGSPPARTTAARRISRSVEASSATV